MYESNHGNFVGTGKATEGKLAVDLPKEVISYRSEYLWQTLEDLDAIDTQGNILCRSRDDDGLSLIADQEQYVHAVGWAVSALAQRVRRQCIGPMADEYRQASSSARKL